MLVFLIFMWIINFINFKQMLVLGLFEILCQLYRKWEKRK